MQRMQRKEDRLAIEEAISLVIETKPMEYS